MDIQLIPLFERNIKIDNKTNCVKVVIINKNLFITKLDKIKAIDKIMK